MTMLQQADTSVRALGSRSPHALTGRERAHVAATVKAFLAEGCERAIGDVGDATRLEQDLDVDSWTCLELFEEVGSQLGIDVEIAAVVRHAEDHPADTVGDLVDQICVFLEDGAAVTAR
jgi:acyl carrier protein